MSACVCTTRSETCCSGRPGTRRSVASIGTAWMGARFCEYVAGYASGTAMPLRGEEIAAVPMLCLSRQLEDLRQRLSLLPTLEAARDAEFAALIETRVAIMDQLRAEARGCWNNRRKGQGNMDIINLRSDTQTLPTEAMMRAIQEAPLGDDTYDEDPTVQKLETAVARMFGKEAALLCISGNMANLACLIAHATPGDEVLIDPDFAYLLLRGRRNGDIAGLMPMPVPNDDRQLDPDEVRGGHSRRRPPLSRTRAALPGEHAQPERGRVMPPCAAQGAVAPWPPTPGTERSIVDGARIFNAAIAAGSTPPTGRGRRLLMFCLSKGLAARSAP